MNIPLNKKYLSLALVLAASSHAYGQTIIDWGLEEGSNFTFGDPAYYDGTYGSFATNSPLTEAVAGGHQRTLSGGALFELKYQNSAGTGDQAVVAGQDTAYLNAIVQKDSATSSGYGGIVGGVGLQSASGLVLEAIGGPLEQVNTINTTSVRLNFNGVNSSGVTGLKFALAGINSIESGGPGGPISSDALTISAKDGNGSVLAMAASYFTESANAIFLIGDPSGANGYGSNLLRVRGDDSNPIGTSNPGSDHTRTDTNLLVDFGSQAVSEIIITYDPTVNGTAAGTSSGFAIGEVAYNQVPEPSSSLLASLGFMAFILKRKR